jgi:hypothetical protein
MRLRKSAASTPTGVLVVGLPFRTLCGRQDRRHHITGMDSTRWADPLFPQNTRDPRPSSPPPSSMITTAIGRRTRSLYGYDGEVTINDAPEPVPVQRPVRESDDARLG